MSAKAIVSRESRLLPLGGIKEVPTPTGVVSEGQAGSWDFCPLQAVGTPPSPSYGVSTDHEVEP